MSSTKRDGPSRPINKLKYHRRKINWDRSKAPRLNATSKRCLRNLVAHRSKTSLYPFPRSRCAAVLVALFIGRSGDLYVLLNRRSLTLRAYAGDTSLPGGKVEPSDRTFEDTARREAYEEIGLIQDKNKVPLLCVMEPFLASNQLIVTPVVVLILDNTLRPILNKDEVSSLFSHPLASFLSKDAPFPSESELDEVYYHTHTDFDYSGTPFSTGEKRKVRVHSFLTGREAGGIKPVFGLTAAICLAVAKLGYDRPPDFIEHPLGVPTMEERIAWAVYSNPAFCEAFQQEGILPDWKKIEHIANVGKNIPPPSKTEFATSRKRPRNQARSKL